MYWLLWTILATQSVYSSNVLEDEDVISSSVIDTRAVFIFRDHCFPPNSSFCCYYSTMLLLFFSVLLGVSEEIWFLLLDVSARSEPSSGDVVR